MGLHASVGYKLGKGIWLNGDTGKLFDYDKWVNAMESTNGRSEIGEMCKKRSNACRVSCFLWRNTGIFTEEKN